MKFLKKSHLLGIVIGFLMPLQIGFIILLPAIGPANALSEHPSSAPKFFTQAPATQDSQNACFSLDVVFLLDQSGSMSGANGEEPNDPTEQRVYAARWAIDWLTDNALDICPQAIHRIAIISYGNSAYLDLELSNVDPDNQNEATRLRDRLKANIQPKDLSETNPKLAFQLAKQVLDDAAPIGNMPRKRAIIFITDGHPCVKDLGCTPPNSTMDFVAYAREMTDQVKNDFPFNANLLQQEQCLKEARETYGVDAIPAEVSTKCLADNHTGPEAFAGSTYIWTLLLKHGTAYSNRLREEYVEMSDSHAGAVINLTENREDIPSTFLDILTQLAGVKAQRLSCGNFAVNPYLRQMRLVFFKVDADNKVTLSYVDARGNTHTIENGQGDEGFVIAEHGEEGANERYVIDNPYPGIWNFKSDDCNGINAYYEPLEMAVGGLPKPLQLLAPSGTAYFLDATFGDQPQLLVPKTADPARVREVDKSYLQYTVRDTNGNVVSQAELPLFEIQFFVNVTDPRGGKESYEMGWLADKKLFQSKTWLNLPYQGEYQVSIIGEAFNREFPYGPVESNQSADTIFNGKRQLFDYTEKFKVVCPSTASVEIYPWPEDITRDDDGCDVLPVRDYDIKVTEPAENQNLPVHGAILDGWPLPIRPIEFTITLVDADGEELSPDGVFKSVAAPFQVTLTAGDKTVQATYHQDPTRPSRYIGTISDFNGTGKHLLVVNLTGVDTEFYEPLNRSVSRTFNRQDNLWSSSGTYFGMLVLTIFLAITYVTYQIKIRDNKVNGTVVFRAGNTVIRSYALGSGKNWKDISTRDLGRHPELDLERLRVSSRPKKQAKRRQPDSGSGFGEMSSVSTSGLNLDHPGVSVSGRTRSKRNFNRILEPRVGHDYSSETEACMEYYPPGEYEGD